MFVVAEHFDASYHSTSKALARLRKKGSAVGKGSTHTRTYAATHLDPSDCRGTAPQTLATLKKYSLAHGRLRPLSRAKPKGARIALELAWKLPS